NRRRNTSWPRDWSSGVCSSDLPQAGRPQPPGWHEPLRAPRARADDVASLEVEVFQLEVEALRGAHPRGIEELEDRAVAQTAGFGRVRRLHERRGGFERQCPRQRAPAPRDLDVLRRIAVQRPGAKQVTV